MPSFLGLAARTTSDNAGGHSDGLRGYRQHAAGSALSGWTVEALDQSQEPPAPGDGRVMEALGWQGRRCAGHLGEIAYRCGACAVSRSPLSFVELYQTGFR